MSQRLRSHGWCAMAALATTLFACSTPARNDASTGDSSDAVDTVDTADTSGPPDGSDASATCRVDNDCADHVFCNGVERCVPGATNADARGCVRADPASPCAAGQTCDEAASRCMSTCPHALDADGDGHRAVDCGGDDCDDADANRFPGNPEVCDPANRDEDCDARTFGVRDGDGDMYSDAQCCNTDAMGAMRCGDDCDDSRSNVHPGLAESCDGLDNNCNTTVDEDVVRTFYPDVDRDGFGNEMAPMTAWAHGCVPPVGFTELRGDCADSNDAVHPGATETCNAIDDNCNGSTDEGVTRTFYRDADTDGYGNPGAPSPAPSCSPAMGYVSDNTDCNDTCSSCHPGGAELCDAVDNDCDTAIDEGLARTFYRDADGDGFGNAATSILNCAQQTGYVENRTDCNDDPTTGSAIHPGATETCDAIDDNCNGTVDEGVTRTFYSDADNDGYGNPGAPSAAPSCSPALGFVNDNTDCNDTCSSCHPGGAELCDAVDNDCDTAVDEGLARTFYRDADGDGFGNPATSISNCAQQTGYVENRTDCNDDPTTGSAIHPGAVEACDGVDNDCNGTIDTGLLVQCYPDTDNDGYTTAGATPTDVCPVGGRQFVGGCPNFSTNIPGVAPSIDCAPTISTQSPGAIEVCNRIDDNCDGAIDEGVVGTFYPDGDGDGYGDPTGTTVSSCGVPFGYSVNNADCDDLTARRRPGLAETCDGLDNDCNSVVDDAAATDAQCAVANGTGLCRGGACTIISCRINRASCDGVRTNGCEVDLTTDPTNCGACGTSCGAGPCVGGRCDRVTAVAGGSHFACALRESGAVSCWGHNGENRLGDGTNFSRVTPVPVQGLAASAVQLAVGEDFVCVRLSTNAVQCWGSNQIGQRGIGSLSSQPTPQYVQGLTDAVEVTAGGHHACARRAGGTVVCWGDNGERQLGDGLASHFDCSGTECSPVPVTVSGISNATGLAAGRSHSCALLATGAVSCWGGNTDGQLGDGTTTPRATPVPVTGLFDAVEIEASSVGTCARLSTGGVRCWGDNSLGQVGDGTNTDRLVPTDVTGLSSIVEIASDASTRAEDGLHVCARTSGGAVWCWGAGGNGQLGDSASANRATPAQVTDVPNAVSLGLGGTFSCAMLSDGRTQCWGSNGFGELGDGTTVARNVPASVSDLANFSVVETAPGGRHTCARRATGSVLCWGNNTYGELGDGTVAGHTTPVGVSGVVDARGVAPGGYHSCAVRSNGTVVCWGRNNLGQIGDGTSGTDRLVPTPVLTITNAVQVTAGVAHSCALLSTGTVMCWGGDYASQIGDGPGNTPKTAPVAVLGLSDAVEVRAGAHYTCARRANGTVLCWGENRAGQIGDGTTTEAASPQAVATIDDALGVDAGDAHSCVLRASGAMACWGSNDWGQIGDNGPVSSRLVPSTVVGLTDVVEFAVGWAHTCARRATGTLACWGSNFTGELGDGTNSPRPTPRAVSGITGALSIAAGGDVSGSVGAGVACARMTDGTVRCWGNNSEGQLGDGTNNSRNVPVTVIGLP